MSDGPTITLARAGELLHCGRTRVFELIREGVLEIAPRFGRKTTLVTASVLKALAMGPRKPGRRARAARSTPPAVTRAEVQALLKAGGT